MTEKLATLLADYSDGDLQARTYSGRAMYGKETHAVVGDEIIPFVVELMIDLCDDTNEDDQKLINELARAFRTDSMGLQTVWY